MGKGVEMKKHNLRKSIHQHANIHVSVKINDIHVNPTFSSREECEL